MIIKLGMFDKIEIKEADGLVQVGKGGKPITMFNKKDLTGISSQVVPAGLKAVTRLKFMGNGTELGGIAVDNKHALKVMAKFNEYFGFNNS